MVRVKNLTPGPLFIDVPPEGVEHGKDPVAEMLSSIDVSKGVSAEDALKVLVGLELAKRATAQMERTMSEAAMRRTKDTLDLWPAYQGEGKPDLVTEVDEAIWARAVKIPLVAARIALGQLRAEGQAVPF